MKERPILFSGEMVKAILEGRKTMTRRLTTRYYGDVGDRLWVRETWRVGMREDPYQQYKGVQYKADELCPEYDKDELPIWLSPESRNMGVSPHWKPSIFMPRWASRITLEITDTRVGELQNITEEDAEKEGMPDEYPIDPVYCPNCQGQGTCGAIHPRSLGYMEIDCPECDTAKKKFKNLWDSINGRGRKPGRAWENDPWVWVISFKVVEA